MGCGSLVDRCPVKRVGGGCRPDSVDRRDLSGDHLPRRRFSRSRPGIWFLTDSDVGSGDRVDPVKPWRFGPGAPSKQ